MSTIDVRVSRVNTQPGSTLGYGWGIDERTGEDVFFAGDWRPMVALAEAVGHKPEDGEMYPPNLISVSIDEWQVIGRGPGFGYEPDPETPCGCGHPKHWRECRASGCQCRRRGPNPSPVITESELRLLDGNR